MSNPIKALALATSLLLVGFNTAEAKVQADRQSEPGSSIVISDGRNETLGSGANYSREFFLGRSEYFSLEVVQDGGANYDIDVQFWSYDHTADVATWTTYDLGAGSDVAAVTASWHLTDLSLPYWDGRVRVLITVNSGATDFTLILHRDSGNRNP